MGSRYILITSNKHEDHIKKNTAIEKLWAGMCSRIKSENMNPFLFSIALKKKGRQVRIPVKIAIPIQNFHLNEGIFHASDHFKLKA